MIELDSQAETEAHAAAMACAMREPCVIMLEGDLGTGKTTWTRAFLRALGHRGVVPSPTYTLVEPYEASGFQIYHVDLYRVQETQELEELGLREMLDGVVVLLVEWPERWPGMDAQSDVRLRFAHGDGEQARRVQAEPLSECGRELLARCSG